MNAAWEPMRQEMTNAIYRVFFYLQRRTTASPDVLEELRPVLCQSARENIKRAYELGYRHGVSDATDPARQPDPRQLEHEARD